MMEIDSGYRLSGMRAIDGTPLVLEAVTIAGDVAGARFDAQVIQRFRNPGEKHVEVVYTFPLPWGAVLLGVAVELGERRLTGRIVERSQAEGAYEEAIADGDAAIMIERNADASYTLNLGNLAPRERCAIHLRYAQSLAFDKTGLRLMIPTLVAPRYGNVPRDTGLRPHQWVEHDPTVTYPFALALTLGVEFSCARIASPSHPVAIQRDEAGRMAITLAREGALDRDFVLVLSQLAQPSLGLVAIDQVRPARSAVLASFCPQFELSDPTGVVVKLLVDCSGSMQGASIEAARRALGAIVASFGEHDRFSLSRFGSSFQHRSRDLWRTTEATRHCAQRWVGQLMADMGGTEMAAALDSLFAQGGADRAGACDVLLVTDGHITAVDRTIEAARARGHRLFVVAIGSSPSDHFLRRLAEETGGACDFVNAGEAVEPAVVRMFARLRSPRMTDLALRWPEGTEPEWVSPIGSAVFDGDTLTIHACVQGRVDGALELLGRRTPQASHELIGRAELRLAADDGALARMVAAARMRWLERQDTESARVAALQLALDYQLVNDAANFLLVAERNADDKAGDMPDLVKVKAMMPAGYGGFGVVRSPVPDVYMNLADSSLILRSPTRLSVHATECSYDIPAFLRQGGAGDQPPGLSGPARAAHHGEELSPSQLLDWLDARAISSWPRTFASMRQIGVAVALLEWLEFVGARGMAEEDAVRAFLDALCDAAVWARIGHHPRAGGNLQRRAREVAIPEPVAAMLSSIRDDCWPDCIDALRVG